MSETSGTEGWVECKRCGWSYNPSWKHWCGEKEAVSEERPCDLCGAGGKLGLVRLHPGQPFLQCCAECGDEVLAALRRCQRRGLQGDRKQG